MIRASRVGADPGGNARPVRTCVGCRLRCPDVELLRVVVKDGAVVPDPRHIAPGRGAWIHPTPECVTTAAQRRAFARAFQGAPDLDVTPVRQYVLCCPERADDHRGDDVREQGNEVDPS